MNEKEFTIKDLSDMPAAARWLLQAVGSRRAVAFDAPMGAGKTTLIAEIVRQLGGGDTASSPTFSIVNVYNLDGKEDAVVYHFDFYRLESPEAVADIGIYDYLDSGSLCLMEWPEAALPFLPEDTLPVRISVNPDSSRTVTLLA